MINVSIPESEGVTTDIEGGLEEATLFAIAKHEVVVIGGCHDGPAAEGGVSVVTTLKSQVTGKDRGQSGEGGQFGGQITSGGSGDPTIDLLKGDEIGLGLADHIGDTMQVHPAVEPFAVVDVPGQDAQGEGVFDGRGRGGGAGAATEKGGRHDQGEDAQGESGEGGCDTVEGEGEGEGEGEDGGHRDKGRR